MIKGVHSVIISTGDLPRVAGFYGDTLGLEAEFESDHEVVFAASAGGQVCVAAHSEVKGPARDSARIMIDFAVDDCRAEYERLTSRGVKFVKAPAEDDGFIVATFLDPDGNTLQLFQPVEGAS